MRGPAKKFPPLEPGDRLQREEFERRFDATPGLKKAELLDRIVYMPPPVEHEYHSGPPSAVDDDAGIWRSSVFPGLSIASRPLLEGELSPALQVLQQDVARSEHNAFVERLREWQACSL